MTERNLDKVEVKFSRSGFRNLMSQDWTGVVALGIFYIMIFIAFSVLSPYFLQTRNLMSIGSNMSVIGLMAIAGTPLIIAGGLDLSVAAIAGVSGVIVSLLYGAGINVWAACAIAVAIAAALGGFNGFLTTRLRLDPLIVTLGTMSIFHIGCILCHYCKTFSHLINSKKFSLFITWKSVSLMVMYSLRILPIGNSHGSKSREAKIMLWLM